MNKRGQEGGTTLGTIVGIILLVLLLAVLIWSFTAAGRDFWAKTLNLQGGTTLDSAIQGCTIAADSGASNSFCSELKYVNMDGNAQYVTCSFLSDSNRLDKSLDCSGANKDLANNCLALKKTKIVVNGVTITAAGECVTAVAKLGGCSDMGGQAVAKGTCKSSEGNTLLYSVDSAQDCCKLKA